MRPATKERAPMLPLILACQVKVKERGILKGNHTPVGKPAKRQRKACSINTNVHTKIAVRPLIGNKISCLTSRSTPRTVSLYVQYVIRHLF